MATIRSKEVDGVLIVGFAVEELLHEPVIQQVGRELIEQVGEVGPAQKIVLTLNRVKLMSSAMLGKLVLFLKKCQKHEVQLKLCSVSPEIYQVFKITSLHKLFDIHKDEQAAIASFKKKGWFGR